MKKLALFGYLGIWVFGYLGIWVFVGSNLLAMDDEQKANEDLAERISQLVLKMAASESGTGVLGVDHNSREIRAYEIDKKGSMIPLEEGVFSKETDDFFAKALRANRRKKGKK